MMQNGETAASRHTLKCIAGFEGAAEKPRIETASVADSGVCSANPSSGTVCGGRSTHPFMAQMIWKAKALHPKELDKDRDFRFGVSRGFFLMGILIPGILQRCQMQMRINQHC